MACRFEIAARGKDRQYLRDAAEQAFAVVDEVENELSVYRPASEISRINALAATEPVRLSPPVFRLIQRALELSERTGGAFDITSGPLVRAWGFLEGGGREPGQEEIERALKLVGARHVHLNPDDCNISFDARGVEMNPGAVGKGHAVDRAVETLMECGVPAALVHSGTSTVRAFGDGPGSGGWRVGIRHPRKPDARWTEVVLHDEALSTSGDYEQFFEREGCRFGHVLDPRTGRPAAGAVSATVITRSAADSDALSTAAMVIGQQEFEQLRPGGLAFRAIFITQGDLDEGIGDHAA